MKRTADDICNEIKNFSKEQYLKGVSDVLDILNEKYLIKVWHKEDAEKLFDDFFDALRDLNVRYAEYSKTIQTKYTEPIDEEELDKLALD